MHLQQTQRWVAAEQGENLHITETACQRDDTADCRLRFDKVEAFCRGGSSYR